MSSRQSYLVYKTLPVYCFYNVMHEPNESISIIELNRVIMMST